MCCLLYTVCYSYTLDHAVNAESRVEKGRFTSYNFQNSNLVEDILFLYFFLAITTVA